MWLLSAHRKKMTSCEFRNSRQTRITCNGTSVHAKPMCYVYYYVCMYTYVLRITYVLVSPVRTLRNARQI